jgi:hypothetical protein
VLIASYLSAFAQPLLQQHNNKHYIFRVSSHALSIQCAQHMRRTIPSSGLQGSHKPDDLQKKITEHKTRVLIFSTILVSNGAWGRVVVKAPRY